MLSPIMKIACKIFKPPNNQERGIWNQAETIV